MNAIRLTPEAVKVLNEYFEEGNIESHICHLANAEIALFKAAYDDDSYQYMWRYGYEIRKIRHELSRLQKILGYQQTQIDEDDGTGE